MSRSVEAPVGTWKVDVVEQGSGFTDSKVFAVGETETPPITLPSTTTTTGAPTTEPGDHGGSDHRADHGLTTTEPTTAPTSGSDHRWPTTAPTTEPTAGSDHRADHGSDDAHHPTGHRAGVSDQAIR